MKYFFAYSVWTEYGLIHEDSSSEFFDDEERTQPTEGFHKWLITAPSISAALELVYCDDEFEERLELRICEVSRAKARDMLQARYNNFFRLPDLYQARLQVLNQEVYQVVARMW